MTAVAASFVTSIFCETSSVFSVPCAAMLVCCVTFGRDQNAFTSFDQTTYQLTLPGGGRDVVEKGLLFMSDVAMRMSLGATEIDGERQIILEEKRARGGGQGHAERARRHARSGREPAYPGRRIDVKPDGHGHNGSLWT